MILKVNLDVKSVILVVNIVLEMGLKIVQNVQSLNIKFMLKEININVYLMKVIIVTIVKLMLPNHSNYQNQVKNAIFLVKPVMDKDPINV